MKRIAVLGGTGMAGTVAVKYLKEQGYDVCYTSLDAPDTKNSKALDATDTRSLIKWLDSVKPDVIYNCMGILQKTSDARPDLAIMLNSYLPKYLEQKYKETNVKIIQLSTDCVFSGDRGEYNEADIPDGKTIYDRTKLLGEIDNDKDLTFRMSIIGPEHNVNGTGLFNWFMGQNGTIRGFTNVLWTGLTTIELTRAVDEAIKQNLTGLYHLATKKPISKYDLLILFKQIFNRHDICIESYDDHVSNKTLVCTRTDFDFKMLDHLHQIEDMRDWIGKHSTLYEHYRFNG